MRICCLVHLINLQPLALLVTSPYLGCRRPWVIYGKWMRMEIVSLSITYHLRFSLSSSSRRGSRWTEAERYVRRFHLERKDRGSKSLGTWITSESILTSSRVSIIWERIVEPGCGELWEHGMRNLGKMLIHWLFFLSVTPWRRRPRAGGRSAPEDEKTVTGLVGQIGSNVRRKPGRVSLCISPIITRHLLFPLRIVRLDSKEWKVIRWGAEGWAEEPDDRGDITLIWYASLSRVPFPHSFFILRVSYEIDEKGTRSHCNNLRIVSCIFATRVSRSSCKKSVA